MASEEEKADEAAAKKLEAYCGRRGRRGGAHIVHMAAMDGNVGALRHFLRVAPERVDEKYPATGSTPLHLAALNGHVAAAELLLSKGAPVDAENINGRTPLHVAAENGQVAAAELLLSKGAAVDAKTDDGKTPLDFAREKRRTKMEQFLLNASAKKPSPDDGKTPRDLSSKGKAEKEPLPTAADKTSEAGKKDLSSPAGSGAAAAKHQRQASKEEAAKELKKTMESGNAQALKEAIDVAKSHKVSHKDIMEAMDKYFELRESAEQRALSPAEEASKAAKFELKVKLEPGHDARIAMVSARFNAKNKDTETKFRAVHKILLENHYDVLMVEAGAGTSFGDMTLDYLYRLQQENGVMLAVCTSDYGEMTDSPFCTYYELKLAKEYNLDVLPLQVEDNWKPNPPCGEGHRDHSKKALSYIHAVFIPSIVRIDCRNKPVDDIACEIAAALRKAS